MHNTQQHNGLTFHYNVTEDNPLVSEDYPWGFKLRTTQRYWIETKPSHGQRFVYQTLNPKTDRWCAPKKGTYSPVLIAYRNEDDHVKCTGFSRYTEPEGLKEFLAIHKDYLDEYQLKTIDLMIKSKEFYSKVIDKAEQEAARPRPELDLTTKTFWTKEEITKSPIDLELIAVDLKGQGLKKRQRKLQYQYERIGFITSMDDIAQVDAIQKAQDFEGQHFKDSSRLQIVFKKVTYNAPSEGSPLFYGFREDLMSCLKRIPLTGGVNND